MRGTLFVVSLILIFTTLTEGSAFHHHARTRKQMKTSFNSALKPDHKGSLGKYLYTKILEWTLVLYHIQYINIPGVLITGGERRQDSVCGLCTRPSCICRHPIHLAHCRHYLMQEPGTLPPRMASCAEGPSNTGAAWSGSICPCWTPGHGKIWILLWILIDRTMSHGPQLVVSAPT